LYIGKIKLTEHQLNINLIEFSYTEVSSSQNTELYLPTNICRIIMDDSFWSQISQLSTLM